MPACSGPPPSRLLVAAIAGLSAPKSLPTCWRKCSTITKLSGQCCAVQPGPTGRACAWPSCCPLLHQPRFAIHRQLERQLVAGVVPQHTRIKPLAHGVKRGTARVCSHPKWADGTGRRRLRTAPAPWPSGWQEGEVAMFWLPPRRKVRFIILGRELFLIIQLFGHQHLTQLTSSLARSGWRSLVGHHPQSGWVFSWYSLKWP